MDQGKQLEILSNISADTRDKIQAAVETTFALDGDLKLRAQLVSAEKYDHHVSFTFCTPGKKNEDLASFTIHEFPGCTHLVLSTSFNVSSNFRRTGFGKAFNALRLKAMTLAGFSKMLATVNDCNEAEIKVLLANDWQKISSFRGYNGQRVSLWERIL